MVVTRPAYRCHVLWLSVEVFDGAFSARLWREAHGDALTETALTNGAASWEWHEHRWGVVLELAFLEDESRDAFRDVPAVRAALDAVPDPVSGLLVYRGRGGGAGAGVPRRPRPAPIAGAAALPDPEPDGLVDLAGESAATALVGVGGAGPGHRLAS